MKKLTQTEIAEIMNLTRQTVSKLLNDAIREKIVEIKIQDPEIVCTELQQAIRDEYEIENVVVCGVSADEESLCLLMTIKKGSKAHSIHHRERKSENRHFLGKNNKDAHF